MLRASEIGSYAFCPMAWYIQRQGHQPDPGSHGRLSLGLRRHRAIGRRADRVRLVRRVRHALLVMGLTLALLALLTTFGSAP